MKQTPSLASLRDIGLKNGYFEIEEIIEEHLMRMPVELEEKRNDRLDQADKEQIDLS